MRFNAYLSKEETQEGLDELAISTALIRFIKEQNRANATVPGLKPILLEDVIAILSVVSNSDLKWKHLLDERLNRLMEAEGENTI